MGFLADKRRINVAITRARRHVCVICDSETVAHDPFLASLIDYMSTNGEVQSACQYIDGKDTMVDKFKVICHYEQQYVSGLFLPNHWADWTCCQGSISQRSIHVFSWRINCQRSFVTAVFNSYNHWSLHCKHTNSNYVINLDAYKLLAWLTNKDSSIIL